jgi:hypothetical protein
VQSAGIGKFAGSFYGMAFFIRHFNIKLAVGIDEQELHTFPLFVAGFDVSCAAAPWCANAGAEIISRPSAM